MNMQSSVFGVWRRVFRRCVLFDPLAATQRRKQQVYTIFLVSVVLDSAVRPQKLGEMQEEYEGREVWLKFLSESQN
jgi:hypothetical protein